MPHKLLLLFCSVSFDDMTLPNRQAGMKASSERKFVSFRDFYLPSFARYLYYVN